MRLFAFVLSLILAGPTLAEPDPLFQSQDILKVTIAAPFKRILQTRSLEEEETGTFAYTDEAGELQEFNIQIRARGKSRLEPQTCSFPPIRLNFKKSETKDTLFHKQDKVKLVTHCKSDSVVHKQGLLREYIVYRVFNMLTDRSFHVRLLEITYEDSETKRRPQTEFGFLIEHKDRVGKRLDARAIEPIGSIEVELLDSRYMNLTSVFHYLIANVDFSAFAAADNEECCHNHVLFDESESESESESEESYFSIPYDFDMSGFVSAEYATPNPRYGLRRITQRFYRGRCANNHYLPETLAVFSEKREEISSLIDDQPDLSRYSRKLIRRLVEEFYEILDDPRLIENRLVRKCL